MIFTKEFKGCKAGEIYPTTFKPGDECPPELQEAAVVCEVVEVPTEKAAKPRKTKE
jgi:hypothetical protein